MLRGAPLKRGKPLKRKTRLRSRSKRNSYRRRDRDMDYMAFVRKQPCDLSFTGKCTGRVQADHAGAHGLGQKCPDNQCIPLCRKHHNEKTDYRGYFADLTGPAIRQWLDQRVHHYQVLYANLVELRQTPWRA